MKKLLTIVAMMAMLTLASCEKAADKETTSTGETAVVETATGETVLEDEAANTDTGAVVDFTTSTGETVTD